MYSPTHSAVATAILLAPIPFFISVPLAILSHAFVDKLGESYVDNWVKIDTALLLILIGFGLMTGNLLLVLLGIFCGNFFDILDKIVFNYLFKKELIHSLKIYPKVSENLTKEQTIMFDIFSIILVCGVLV